MPPSDTSRHLPSRSLDGHQLSFITIIIIFTIAIIIIFTIAINVITIAFWQRERIGRIVLVQRQCCCKIWVVNVPLCKFLLRPLVCGASLAFPPHLLPFHHVIININDTIPVFGCYYDYDIKNMKLLR